MGVNIVQSFCVILHEIHTKCSLELELSILILGEATNANLPSKNIPFKANVNFNVNLKCNMNCECCRQCKWKGQVARTSMKYDHIMHPREYFVSRMKPRFESTN